MKRFLFIALGIATLLTCLTACSSDDGPAQNVYQTIATYQGNFSNQARFTYQAIDDSPVITLNADVAVSEDPDKGQVPGKRVFITYQYAPNTPPGASGNIHLLSIAKVYQSTVAEASTIPDSEWFSVVTFSRSGTYLNLYALAPATSQFSNREFTIVVDQSTIDNAVPQLYLTTRVKNDESTTYNDRAIGSFDIASIWLRPNVEAVDVHVPTDASNPTVYRFSKETSEQE